jgi:hypothetical protein
MARKRKRDGLIYKGKGFIVKVPSRDLTEEEAQKFGKQRLIETGLYQDPNPPQPPPAEEEPIILDQPDEAEESED